MEQTVQNPNANLPALPALTSDNITPPIPDVGLAVMPTPMVADCGWWWNLNQWIAQNPQLAVGILLVGSILLWPKGRK